MTTAHLFPTANFGPQRRAACGTKGGWDWTTPGKRVPLCAHCDSVARILGPTLTATCHRAAAPRGSKV